MHICVCWSPHLTTKGREDTTNLITGDTGVYHYLYMWICVHIFMHACTYMHMWSIIYYGNINNALSLISSLFVIYYPIYVTGGSSCFCHTGATSDRLLAIQLYIFTYIYIYMGKCISMNPCIYVYLRIYVYMIIHISVCI